MVLRMAGGDLNAWVALIGFAAGIGVGVLFLKKGFSLGRAEAVKKAEGLALPVIVIAVFVLSITTTVFAVSQSGPGSMHAPVALSVIGGIAFGVIAQRTRLCFAGGLRDTFLVRDGWGLVVIGILFAGVLVYNLASGHFNLGFCRSTYRSYRCPLEHFGYVCCGLQRYAFGRLSSASDGIGWLWFRRFCRNVHRTSGRSGVCSQLRHCF